MFRIRFGLRCFHKEELELTNNPHKINTGINRTEYNHIYTSYKDRIMRFYCLDWRSLILLVCFILLGRACRVGAMGSISIPFV